MRSGGTPSTKLTYDDFLLFPDDGKRHEIIGGEHYVTPSPNTKHQDVSVNLTALLWNFLKAHPIGRVYAAPLDVVLSHYDVVEPDLLYVSRERSAVVTAKHLRGAPDLAVEILSPGTRKVDEIKKRDVYDHFGAAEYWVVDSGLDAIKIYRRLEGAFARVAELAAERGDLLTTPLLPGFSVKLTDVFESLVSA